MKSRHEDSTGWRLLVEGEAGENDAPARECRGVVRWGRGEYSIAALDADNLGRSRYLDLPRGQGFFARVDVEIHCGETDVPPLIGQHSQADDDDRLEKARRIL